MEQRLEGVPCARRTVRRRAFTLIAAAELRITASLAAILNATTPLFALLIGAARMREALNARRLCGVLLGMAGVAVLVGL